MGELVLDSATEHEQAEHIYENLFYMFQRTMKAWKVAFASFVGLPKDIGEARLDCLIAKSEVHYSKQE